MISLTFQCFTPAFAATPDFLASLPFGQFIRIDAAFVFVCIYMGEDMRINLLIEILEHSLLTSMDGRKRNARFINILAAWQVALGIWTSAWVLQFIGHGIFESEGTY